jgi:hypothetical protein
MELLLFFSLFFPRISLFIAWIYSGIPFNNVPLFFDALGTIIFPRLLIMYYIIYADLGTGWLIAHIIALIIKALMNGVDEVKNKKRQW